MSEDLDVFSRKLWNRDIAKQINAIRSPIFANYYARVLAEWEALPWYVRAWRVAKSRWHAYRRRLGEIIAGERFDD